MDQFDLPPPGLVLGIVVLLVVVPLGFAIFVPLAVFRASFRMHRAAWAQTRPFVVDGAYRGSTVLLDTPPRVPYIVVLASLLSLFLATPVVFALPVAIAGLLTESLGVVTALCVQATLWTAASAVVGYAILRPAREGARAARVVAAWGLAFALVVLVADRDGTGLACASMASAHAAVLLAAAAANDRATASASAPAVVVLGPGGSLDGHLQA